MKILFSEIKLYQTFSISTLIYVSHIDIYIGSTKNRNMAKISSIVTNSSRLNKKGIIMSLIIDVFTLAKASIENILFLLSILSMLSVLDC